MSNIELKNCPFCGSEAKAFGWSATAEIEIICQNEECGAMQTAMVSTGWDESEEESTERAYQIAKEKWNRRDDND